MEPTTKLPDIYVAGVDFMSGRVYVRSVWEYPDDIMDFVSDAAISITSQVGHNNVQFCFRTR